MQEKNPSALGSSRKSLFWLGGATPKGHLVNPQRNTAQ